MKLHIHIEDGRPWHIEAEGPPKEIVAYLGQVIGAIYSRLLRANFPAALHFQAMIMAMVEPGSPVWRPDIEPGDICDIMQVVSIRKPGTAGGEKGREKADG